MIGVLEQTHGRHDHAPGNAALIHAISLALPGEPILFASTIQHRDHVSAVRPLPEQTQCIDIDVPPPKGIRFSRFVAQWRAMRTVMRHVPAPRAIILLSSGPESFFAARAIVTAFPSVVFFIVLHGNLNDAIGWRSRDPRHRLFDYRSGLQAANHPRIRLVVLENHILAAAARQGALRPDRATLWPHAVNENELATGAPAWAGRQRVRIAFAGTATRNKGFHHFLDLAQAADPRAYQFELVGSPTEPIPDAACHHIQIPSRPLSRDSYVRRLRAADYILLPYTEATYEFTSSGSLLDCIAQMRPVIALDFAGARDLVAAAGEVGFVCPSMVAIKALLHDKDRLTNGAQYSTFQRNLATIALSRTPAGIAPMIRRDLARTGVHPCAGLI